MRIVEEIRPNGSKRVKMFTVNPSKTRQEFKDECDLGKIVKKLSATPEGREQLMAVQQYVQERFYDEELPPVDASVVPDYYTAKNLTLRADETFMKLPAEVRKRFKNDTGQFLQFCDDPRNTDELVRMGLLKPVSQAVQEPGKGA